MKKIISSAAGYFGSCAKAVKMTYTASKKYFILYMACTMIRVVIVYLPMFFLRELINALMSYLGGAANADTLYTMLIFAVLYCAVEVFGNAFSTAYGVVSYKYSDALDYYLDNVVLDKIAKIDLAFYDSSKMRNKLNYVTRVMRLTTNAMTMDMMNFIRSAVSLIVSLVLLCELEWWIPLLIIIAGIPYIIGNITTQKKEYEFEHYSSIYDRKLSYYKDIYFGDALQEIKLYDLNGFFNERYNEAWNELHNSKMKLNKNKFTWQSAGFVSSFLGNAAIFLYSVFGLFSGALGVGDITYYRSVSAKFEFHLKSVCRTVPRLVELMKSFEDVREIIEMESKLESGGTLTPVGNPSIEFKNVSFKYPDTERYILKNCSFSLSSGETVGLVGLNGAGKSTVVKLLCRFYDPTEGRILIDGKDAREYDITKLRELFGVLFQSYVRYSFTLRENIALSDISKAENDKALMEACEKSRVTDFIGEWEKGLNENLTRLFDPKGRELSGGQWQRVSLARAFFRDAPIILLDEPSAALDPVAERRIFDDFVSLSKDKSALLISHRLSSITLCDKILFLENGQIIEQGSHSELLKKQGKYSRLFELQASKYEEC